MLNLPPVWKHVTKGVQIVTEWELNPSEGQRSFDRFLSRLLSEETDMPWNEPGLPHCS